MGVQIVTTEAFQGWAILELLGHRQRAGYVREVEIAGGKMLRVDIPVGRDEAEQDILVTEFYGTGALYALRPCAEAVARAACDRLSDPRPIRPVDYRERPAQEAVRHLGPPDDFDEQPF